MTAAPDPLPVCHVCMNDYNVVNATCNMEQGQVMFLALNRADYEGFAGAKLMTPVNRPGPIEGKECKVIVSHCGENTNGGHWVTFILEGDTWWKVDSAVRDAIQEDPFLAQRGGVIGGRSNVTLDVFFFL